MYDVAMKLNVKYENIESVWMHLLSILSHDDICVMLWMQGVRRCIAACFLL